MSETPSTGATTGSTAGTSAAGGGGSAAAPDSGNTGNVADATPTQANPTDSSSVSDDEGVQSLAAQEQTDSDVDHEGTGPGDVDNLPDSDADDTEDGVEKETPSDEQDN